LPEFNYEEDTTIGPDRNARGRQAYDRLQLAPSEFRPALFLDGKMASYTHRAPMQITPPVYTQWSLERGFLVRPNEDGRACFRELFLLIIYLIPHAGFVLATN
jgi:hypothetical protein